MGVLVRRSPPLHSITSLLSLLYRTIDRCALPNVAIDCQQSSMTAGSVGNLLVALRRHPPVGRPTLNVVATAYLNH
jgi:hypothetical protein